MLSSRHGAALERQPAGSQAALRDAVLGRLQAGWSPEQIAGRSGSTGCIREFVYGLYGRCE
jgi:hypothetical protein